MNRKFLIYIALFTSYFLCCSCKTIHENKVEKHNPDVTSSPMACKIEGKIITILKPADADTGSICAKYPCRARVRIMSVLERGSSITFSLKEGDTVEIMFPITLVNTSKVFPGMKVQYPGLKKGDMFMANTEQRLKVGSGGEFIINGYELIEKTGK